MQWFKNIILFFQRKLINKETWSATYLRVPSEIKKVYCSKCWNNLFEAMDKNKDGFITVWEITKYFGRIGWDIYKTISKITKE